MILTQQTRVITPTSPYIAGTEEQRAHAGHPLQSQDHRTKACPPVPCHSSSAISRVPSFLQAESCHEQIKHQTSTLRSPGQGRGPRLAGRRWGCAWADCCSSLGTRARIQIRKQQEPFKPRTTIQLGTVWCFTLNKHELIYQSVDSSSFLR